jgi:tRNA G18 (ribose-2'-O)-methylase SpoU
MSHRPKGTEVILVEKTATSEPLHEFVHPARAIYALGAEDHGFTDEWFDKKLRTIHIETASCLNVAIAGSIAIYDRMQKNVPK